LGAQTASPPVKHQTVVVTGTAEPVPLEESDRSVNVYPLRHSSLLFGSLTDALSLDSSVQVQARAPGGVQGDLSIRGGSFAQNLILIDGIRLSDAQSAHHDLDLPIPLDAVNRIEILRGSGSTLYGSEAVAGVVNVVTAEAPEREFPLFARAYVHPFSAGGLRDSFSLLLRRHAARPERTRQALIDCLRRYERRRRARLHDGPALRGMRLYRLTWALLPRASNFERPEGKELLLEVGRPPA